MSDPSFDPDGVARLLDERGYTVMRELGRGAMGVVLLARQRSLNRHVAIKILLDFSPTLMARFKKEGKIYRELSHPNIVKLLDVETEPPLPFLSFELVPGARTLGELIGPGDPERAWRLVDGLLAGLACIHSHQIVHRDLKPANVLVDEAGEPRIIDLGLARSLDPDTTRYTREGALLGTPAYAPPEQLRGEETGPAADVYAFGLIAIELLAGRHIFTSAATDGVRTYDRLVKGVPDPAQFLPGVHPRVVQELTRCVASSQEDRPRDATELRDALARARAAPAVITRTLVGSGRLPSTQRNTGSGSSGSPAVRALVAFVAIGVVVAAALAAGWRVVPPTTGATASPAVTSPPLAKASAPLDVALVPAAGVVALAGTAPAPATLALKWEDDGRPSSWTGRVDGPFRREIRSRRISRLSVELDGRSLPLSELLRPHALRWTQRLEALNWPSIEQAVKRLGARPYTSPTPVTTPILPAAITEELARFAPLLELAVGEMEDGLHVRMLRQIWRLEKIDAILGRLARRPFIGIHAMAGAWSERLVQQEDEARPSNEWPHRGGKLLGDPGMRLTGKHSMSHVSLVGGPEHEVLVTRLHAILDLDNPFSITWKHPETAGLIPRLDVETDFDAGSLIRVSINGAYEFPICRFIEPADRPKERVLWRVRQLPRGAIRPGQNTLELKVESYYDGEGHKPAGLWIGSLMVSTDRARR